MNPRITVVPAAERDQLLGTPLRGGTLTVRHALDSRKVVSVEILVEETSGVALAIARTRKGVIEHLGSSVYDAIERLGTLAVRP